MTLIETYLPFGLRDVKITPFVGELGVGTPIDLPVGRTVTFRETEDLELLKSDDRNVAMEGTGPMVEWEVEAGGISFEAWQVLTGASLVTGAGFRELVKLDTDVRPYFVIEGQSINDDGSDLHVIIRRCKVSGSVEGTFTEGGFFLTRCEGLGIGDSSGELWRMRWNVGPTSVFGGIRLLPNNISVVARPLTVTTAAVVGATLAPATVNLTANRLQVALGTELVVALQPKSLAISAVPLTVTGGQFVGPTLAPRTLAITAVPLLVSRGLNLVPKNLVLTAVPLIVSSPALILQAESGTVEGGAAIVSEWPGYAGTGYVGYYGLTGHVNQVIATVPGPSDYTFTIRYANCGGSNTVVNIRVNGTVRGTITLPVTGTDWTSAARFATSDAVTLPLSAGSNTIRIEHAGLEYTYADLDYYTLLASGGGVAGVAPVAEFTMNPSSAAVGQSVQFADASQNFPTSWAWAFGDAGASALQNPTHAYAGAGTYNAQLSVANAQGSSSITHSIVITSGGTGGTPDYVVGVNGTLQQLLELPYAQLAGKRILVPSGLWVDNINGHAVYIVNKDFGGLVVEFASGAILRGAVVSGIEMYGQILNLTLTGPGKVQGNGGNTNTEGIIIDSTRGDKGANGQPMGNITIDGLTVEPTPGTGSIQRNGIALWGGDKLTVRNCTIHDAASNAAYGFGGAGSGLSIGRGRRLDTFGGQRVLLENNHIYNMLVVQDSDSADRNGIIMDLWQSDGGGVYADRVIGSVMIRNNNIHDVAGRAIQILRGGLTDSQINVLNNSVSGQWARRLFDPSTGDFSQPATAIGGYGAGVHGNLVISNNTVVTDSGNSNKPAYRVDNFDGPVTPAGVSGVGNVGNRAEFYASPTNVVPAGFMSVAGTYYLTDQAGLQINDQAGNPITVTIG